MCVDCVWCAPRPPIKQKSIIPSTILFLIVNIHHTVRIRARVKAKSGSGSGSGLLLESESELGSGLGSGSVM